MYPQVEYEMSEADYKRIIEASRPTVAIMIDSYAPESPQERANQAWKDLGQRMGFNWQTVKPVRDRGPRFFSAVPSETESAKKERLQRELTSARQEEAARLHAKIAECQARLIILAKSKEEP